MLLFGKELVSGVVRTSTESMVAFKMLGYLGMKALKGFPMPSFGGGNTSTTGGSGGSKGGKSAGASKGGSGGGKRDDMGIQSGGDVSTITMTHPAGGKVVHTLRQDPKTGLWLTTGTDLDTGAGSLITPDLTTVEKIIKNSRGY